MNKYIFKENRLIHTPYCHADSIARGRDYDISIRIIIFDKQKIIYVRINDLSIYQGLEYKQIEYQFNNNLRACEAYLKRNYKKYRVYDSYSINELQDRLQRDILNS